MTAKEVLIKKGIKTMGESINVLDVEKLMIAFAKHHVTEALKQASEKAEAPYYLSPTRVVSALVDKDSILNAYSLTLIT